MAAQAGIYYVDARPVPTEVLEALTRVNQNIGPHGRACYVGEGLAMLAFALHFDELSERERQPILLPDGSVLTWDGRLDNREDLIVRLRHELAGDYADANVMAWAIHKWGDDALRAAVGDWSLAYWRAREHELLLARDYTGNRALYYSCQPTYVVWSTAIEPIIEICDIADAIDDTYMARWLTFEATGDHTMFRNVQRVQAGHVIHLRPGRAHVGRYFGAFTARVTRYHDVRQYEDEYRALFTEAVKVRLRAKRPVWVELSGGYDSSAITCVAHSLVSARVVQASSIQPVSVVTPESPESDESVYVECVEQHCGLRSVRLPVSGHFDINEPTLSAVPDASEGRFRRPDEVAWRAGSHVLLSGELGDVITTGIGATEVLREHLHMRRVWAFVRASIEHCRSVRGSLLHIWMDFASDLLKRKPLEERLRQSQLEGMASGRRMRSLEPAEICGLRRDFLGRALSAPTSVVQPLEEMPAWTHSFISGIQRFLGTTALSASRGPVPFCKTYPFSHRPLVDFILSVPPSVLWRPDHQRAFVCAALGDVLPAAIVARRNKGDASPVVSRYLIPTVMREIGNVQEWQLVARGYAEPRTLGELLAAFVDGSQTTPALVRRLLRAETLLRSVPTPVLPGKCVRLADPGDASSYHMSVGVGTRANSAACADMNAR